MENTKNKIRAIIIESVKKGVRFSKENGLYHVSKRPCLAVLTWAQDTELYPTQLSEMDIFAFKIYKTFSRTHSDYQVGRFIRDNIGRKLDEMALCEIKRFLSTNSTLKDLFEKELARGSFSHGKSTIQDYLSLMRDNPFGFFSAAFSWDSSSQGHNFWATYDNELRNNVRINTHEE